MVQVGWQHFDEQFKGTVAGAVNAVQAVLPAMEEQGYGKIINVGTNLVYNPVVPYYDYTGGPLFPIFPDSYTLAPTPYALHPQPRRPSARVRVRVSVYAPRLRTAVSFIWCGTR